MILSRNRSFGREEPSRDAKLFLIACEGEKREYDYFNYFSELDSRINVEIVKPEVGDDNSPVGLFKKILLLIEGSDDIEPVYELSEDDEVWFVIDTDDWGEKIIELTALVKEYPNFYIAQSNPCFEVWLYYHFTFNEINYDHLRDSRKMKQYLNDVFKGGFDSKKHPILISDAIKNTKFNYREGEDNMPEKGSSQVYLLAERICNLISNKIDSARNKID
ncbi:hypothetical protein CEQ90_20285 [Lewinellaceae bacterium SD302]|nr:hypothetical protein CEQ90_20285 [Lewinellaceae bacterium SD302]